MVTTEEKNITSDTVVMSEAKGQSTNTSSLRGSTAKVGFAISTLFGSGVATTTIPAATTIMAETGGAVATEAAFPVVIKLVGGATALGTLISCEKDTPKPVDPVETKLTAEEQAFADKLAPHPDGTLKYSTLEGGVDPYIFKNFAKINLELVSAKGMSYKATPVIQKKSVADVIAKAKELNPGSKYGYSISLAFVKKKGLTENVLSGTVFITDIQDVNLKIPSLENLPESFGLDFFNKLNPNVQIPTSFNLNSDEELVVRIYVGGGGGNYANFNFGVNPVASVN